MIKAHDSLRVEKNFTKSVKSYVKKNFTSEMNQQNDFPGSLINRLRRQGKDSGYLNNVEIDKTNQQFNGLLKVINPYDMTSYDQSTASSYVQIQPNYYPSLLPSLLPLQKQQQLQQQLIQQQLLQQQLLQQQQFQQQQIQQQQQQFQQQQIQQQQKEFEQQQIQQQQQQFIMQFPINSSTQPSESIYFPNNEALPNANSMSMIPLYCTYIPVPPNYQFPAQSDNLNGEKVLLYPQAYEKEFNFPFPIYNPLKNLISGFLQNCPNTYYRCKDGFKCVPPHKWCDNNIDCLDASDETNCTCRQRISREKICDHFNDCPNGEDEMGCFGCPEHSVSCDDINSNCISMDERCDGIANCNNEKDEKDCNAISESYIYSDDMVSAGSYIGFLQRNFRGRWYPVCGKANSWAKEACITQLGFISEPEYELVKIPNQVKVDSLYIEDNGYSGKLISDCLHGIAYVRCPLKAREDHFEPLISDDPYMVGSAHLNSTNNETNSNPIVGIVGGHDSLPRAWPFIIAIYQDGTFHCGGIILNQRWILSAAHCFNNFKYHYYDIDAGVLRRYSYSPTRQTRRIIGVVIHEYYDSLTLRNDIALGMLYEPLLFNSWVRPANLPRKSEYEYFFEKDHELPRSGDTCIAVGWGATKEGGSDYDHLQEVDLAIITCPHLQDRNRGEICAGYKEGGRDACQGDSGGPLMCRVSDWNYDWYVGGIVSHGVGCGRRNEPGAYTRVSYYNSWINGIINNRMASDNLQRTRSTCPGFVCNKSQTKCMPAKQRCDGVVNCLGAEDEMNCPNFTVPKLLDRLFGYR